MKKLSKNFNIILGMALTAAVILTLIAPMLIGILFRPAVSFGTNCEPAATYSMSKLVWTQFFGLVIGALAGIVWVASRKNPDTKPDSTTAQSAT